MYDSLKTQFLFLITSLSVHYFLGVCENQIPTDRSATAEKTSSWQHASRRTIQRHPEFWCLHDQRVGAATSPVVIRFYSFVRQIRIPGLILVLQYFARWQWLLQQFNHDDVTLKCFVEHSGVMTGEKEGEMSSV